MTVRTLVFLRIVTLAVVACGHLACASTGARNAMLREAEFGPMTEFADPNGNFRSAISLPFEVEWDSDGDLTLEVPLEESEIPVYCFVAKQESELGVSVLRITQSIFDALRQNFELSNLRTAGLDAGAIGDTAYQLVSTFFVLQADGGAGNGLLKVASANKHGYTIHCNQWDAGFIETFERVFSELVRNFEVNEPPPAPSYKEISRIRIGSNPIGVVTMSFFRDADGDIQAISESSMLIPASENEFQGSYSKAVDWANEGGELINSYYFESDVDGEKTSLALKWDDDRGWHFQGVYERKEIADALGHSGPLHSAVSDWLALRRELIPQGEESRVSLERWIPNADPTSVIGVSFTADPANARAATATIGPLEMRMERDQDGLPETTTMNVGSISMIVERIFVDGGL